MNLCCAPYCHKEATHETYRRCDRDDFPTGAFCDEHLEEWRNEKDRVVSLVEPDAVVEAS